ncbi:hypothetical protein ACFV2H_51650 [Streptomyces sp. NPDC059629]|uniref:hypothetical protein n=1 Tax=Streptomyces sp. NPDC059629 TaxID=3346889 RepID=UPI0036AD1750
MNILIRLTCPSTTPEFQGRVRPAMTGVAVAVDTGGEGVEAWQVVVADGVEPLGQPPALPLGENLGERPDISGERVQSGAVDQHGLETEPFRLGEGAGVAEDPAGDRAS